MITPTIYIDIFKLERQKDKIKLKCKVIKQALNI